MNDPTLENQVEQLRRQLERLAKTKQDTDARLAGIGDMRADIAAVEVRMTSPDRSVTVVAGPGGSVKNITFADDSRNLSPAQLSQVTMATLRAAIAEAARRQAGVLQEHIGDSGIVDRVLKTQAAAFARLGETDPTAQLRARPPVTDDDDPAPIMRRDW